MSRFEVLRRSSGMINLTPKGKTGLKYQFENNFERPIDVKDLPKFLQRKVTSLSPYEQMFFTDAERKVILGKITLNLKGIDMCWGNEPTLKEYLNNEKLSEIALGVRFYLWYTTEGIATIRFRLEPITTIKDRGAFEADFGPGEKLLRGGLK